MSQSERSSIDFNCMCKGEDSIEAFDAVHQMPLYMRWCSYSLKYQHAECSNVCFNHQMVSINGRSDYSRNHRTLNCQ